MNKVSKKIEFDEMEKRSSIFKQLILNVIIPVVLAMVVLGTLNYQRTQSLMNDANETKNKLITDEIQNILHFQDFSLDIIEDELDKNLENYSHLIISNYLNNSTEEIETLDLKKVRNEIGMDSLTYDIYVINENGVIINTTFEKDLNFNLFNIGEKHKKHLIEILNNNEFVSERFSIEMKTKKLKKYCYQPTKDNKYIIELGAYSDKANDIVNSFITHLQSISKKQESIASVDFFIGADSIITFDSSTKISNETYATIQNVFNTETSNSYYEKDAETKRSLNYEYIYMDRKNTDLYKGAVIRIVSDRTKEEQLFINEIIKLLLVFSITMILVVYLIYKKTRIITNPIKKLVDKVNRISDGNLNERAAVEGSYEIANLSEKFNSMVERLEEYYLELENKVKERTAEISKQKDEIEEQKKHIMDSIYYARRIQNAILPSDELVSTIMPEAFILYKPKDIVSGDFYWVKNIENKVLFAAVDCTGHGVPGAFMSIVGHNQLNYAVNVKKATSPGEILDQLNAGVTSTLSQKSGVTTVKDGMDIALCSVDYETQKIEFAGAFNPLYYIQDGELKEIKGDKHPIGNYIDENLFEFKNNEIQLKKGDKVYIFSDGYADQFGGPKGKKFRYNQFRELLLSIHALPMNEQKIILDETFEKWRGSMEQIDDILVIGLKI
jgi:phosphoserine phosphatase RsbU/P